MRCEKLQQVFEVQCFGLDIGPQSFCYSFIAVTLIHSSKSVLYIVSPEIRCSSVSSRYCCYGNCTAGSKPS